MDYCILCLTDKNLGLGYHHVDVVVSPAGFPQVGQCACTTWYKCLSGHDYQLNFPVDAGRFNQRFEKYGLHALASGLCSCQDEVQPMGNAENGRQGFEGNGGADGHGAYLARNRGWLERSINGNGTRGFQKDLAIANNILPSTVAALAVSTNPDGKLGDGKPYHGDPALAHVTEDLLPTIGGPLPTKSVTKPMVYDAGMVEVPAGQILIACLQKFSPGAAAWDGYNAGDPNGFGGLVYTVSGTDLPSQLGEFPQTYLPLTSNHSFDQPDLDNSYIATPFANEGFSPHSYNVNIVPFFSGAKSVVKAVNPGFPSADDYTYTQVLGGYVRGEVTFSNSLDSGVVGGVVLNDGKVSREGVLRTGNQYFPIQAGSSVGAREIWDWFFPWNTAEEFYSPPWVASGNNFSTAATTIAGTLAESGNTPTNTLIPTANFWNIVRWATGEASAPDAFQQSLYPHMEQAYTIEPVTATQGSRGLKVRLPSMDLEPMPYGLQGCKLHGTIGGEPTSTGTYTASSVVSNGSAVSPSGTAVFVFRNTSTNSVMVRLTGVLYVTVYYDTSVYFGKICPLRDPYLEMAAIAAAHAPLFAPPNSFKSFLKKGWKAVKSAASAVGPVVADMLLPAALDMIAPGSGEIVAPIAGMLAPVISQGVARATKPKPKSTSSSQSSNKNGDDRAREYSTTSKKAPRSAPPVQPVRRPQTSSGSKKPARAVSRLRSN